MSAVENAIDAAIQFIGPFLGKGTVPQQEASEFPHLLQESLAHLQAINTAEQVAAPDEPYDGSLVGVVYGLLDLITSIGILPYLSKGIIFSQRPKSVLVVSIPVQPSPERDPLSHAIDVLIPIIALDGAGVQPLLVQRIFPDVISALAELSFSPQSSETLHSRYTPAYEKLIATTPVSRLLPILTSLLQQDVPPWWKARLTKELTLIPLRPYGVRHTVEFLALSYLSKNSQVPQDASGPQSKLPLPLESITQAARLLSSVPVEMTQDEWFTQLAPQLLNLLDGNEGQELSRAAGQIIAGGILNKKSIGAPKTIGWELFARPLLETIYPTTSQTSDPKKNALGQIIVDEKNLRRALSRLATLTSSYSHAGVLKRLVGPIHLPLWGLISYASSHPSLDKGWSMLPRTILLRYLTLACEVPRVGNISRNLFWDGEPSWTFAPGSQGGVEIRTRTPVNDNLGNMGDLLSRMASVDQYVSVLVSLLVEANVEDSTAGAIFIQSTKRWLSPDSRSATSLTSEPDVDPLSALVDAKFSEALATQFKEKFARSPQHIIELMGQLLHNFVQEHKVKIKDLKSRNKPTRANLGKIAQASSATPAESSDGGSEDLVSFAISIISTIISSPGFQQTPEIAEVIGSMLPSLQHLSQSSHELPIPPLIRNAAANILQTIQPNSASTPTADPLAQHRVTLKTALTDIVSPEPPNRVWALSAIRKLVQDPLAFPILDIPSLTHTILSASVADGESYVHTAAIPAVVELTVRAPNPTVRILVDAFVDIDERSLRLKKEKEIEEALDFRLRVGEILNNFVAEDAFWLSDTAVSTKYTSLKLIIEATLSLASRRGQRKKTLAKRNELLEIERKDQEEGEAAWGGPIPNLLDPEAHNAAEQAERDALFKIVQGWEDTGIEEDVRVRASALSVLGSVLEKRLELLSQVTVDAALQMVLQIVTIETAEAKGILRRAAVLVVMGLLRGMDGLLEEGKESVAGLGARQMEEVERVMRWARDDDVDGLVRDHAGNVVEGLETWRMKKLYKIRDEGLRLGPDLGLEGHLQGLNVQPLSEQRGTRRKGLIVEEIE
ncbi:hypothetical protein DPSP01_000309 [Paraphaeosphaeria sporulosa]|uniref:RNA polymerase II assembly factor Rtp1 C-terminal domain-containing protein n=1 Tax=Paraphaeosphaeria sporulosa TaxID=1460663 RepID=A0A177D072_9PLEO|nr:uncharacterized protein CC84DRAFT_1160019 [Paraphaeosphaeria sporulosa]OAG12758.1 hypothetical protein CC84DRAFT_1160019 [Paraphaeosphaeria sporulosa]